MKKDIGVYIHIPFCIAKCAYCDFVSFSGKNELIDGYIEALLKEIRNYDLGKYNIKTVYIGGGTPSSIDTAYIGKILSQINEYIDKEAEITIEVNPRNGNYRKIKRI